MSSLKISLGILLALSISRFIPHPPNFTSLIALSFYVPALLGLKFLPFVLLSFIFTDVIIGFHNTLLFTWGSILLIGLISKYFMNSIKKRLIGAIIGAILFFIITNFGIWTSGFYGYSFNGLIECYTLAIPFFLNTLVSTILFSTLIEFIYKFLSKKLKILQN